MKISSHATGIGCALLLPVGTTTGRDGGRR